MKYNIDEKNIGGEMPRKAGVARKRRLSRRVLSLVLAMHLLISSFPLGSMGESGLLPDGGGEPGLGSGSISVSVPEEAPPESPQTVADTGSGVLEMDDPEIQTEVWFYPMGENGTVLLSSVIAEAGVPISINDVETVAVLDDDPNAGTESADLVTVVPMEGDYAILALQSFDEAAVTVYAAGQPYSIHLTGCTAAGDGSFDMEEDPQAGEDDGDQPQDTGYVCSLGGADTVMLSQILDAVNLPISASDVQMVGLIASPENGEALLSAEKTEVDFIITALQDFSEARMVLYTENEAYEICLMDGHAAEISQSAGEPEVTVGEGQNPDEPGAQEPEETTTQLPDETGAQNPDETTTQEPGDTTTQNPDETTTQNPDETTTQNPDEITIQNPDETTTQNPDETTTQNTDETTTQNPDENITQETGDTTTQNPDETTTQEPDETTTQETGDTTTQNPDETTSQNPDDITTQNPDDITTQNPDETTTQNPDETTSQNPDETNPQELGEPTTQLPDDNAAQVTGDEAPQGPEEPAAQEPATGAAFTGENLIVLGPAVSALSDGEILSSWDTDSLRLTLVGLDTAAAVLQPIEVAGTAYQDVLEAYAILDSADCAAIEATLNALPELAAGEYLALYGVRGGQLADAPEAHHLEAGENVHFAVDEWDGFALVKLGMTADRQLPPASASDAVVVLRGELPVVAAVDATPVTGIIIEEGLLLTAAEIAVSDGAGYEFQPLSGAPVEVTIYSDTIYDALNGGYTLEARRYAPDLESYENIDIAFAEGDAVTFLADEFGIYAIVEQPRRARFELSLPGNTELTLSELAALISVDDLAADADVVTTGAMLTASVEAGEWVIRVYGDVDAAALAPEDSIITIISGNDIYEVAVTVTGIPAAEADGIVIAAVSELYLPDGATARYAVSDDTPSKALEVYRAEYPADDGEARGIPFDIGLDGVDAAAYPDGFLVAVTLPEDSSGRDMRLYHRVVGSEGEAFAEPVDAAFEGEVIHFITTDFGRYSVCFTAEYAREEAETEMLGNSQATLTEILNKVGTVGIDEAAATVTAEGPYLTAEQTADGWTIRLDTPDADVAGEKAGVLTVTADGTIHTIHINVAGRAQVTEGGLVIAAADGQYLPDDAEGHSEESQDPEDAVRAVQNFLNGGKRTVMRRSISVVPGDNLQRYAVFDITLDNVGAENYEGGFRVELALPDYVRGTDFRLFHIHEGRVSQIEDAEVTDGTLGFTTPDFSQFVLSYTVETFIDDSDGNTWHVTASYPADIGIPENAALSVTELREGDDGYDAYIREAVRKLGMTEMALGLARAFDIKLLDPDTGAPYQPNGSVKVRIELKDANLNDYEEVGVVHFGDQTEVVTADIGGSAVEFNTNSFSVFVIEGAESVPITTYIFYEKPKAENDTTEIDGFTQTVKMGEKPLLPQMTADSQGRPFDGWYWDKPIGNGNNEFEHVKYDFDNSVSGTVHLYPMYKKFVYVIFHDQYDSVSKTFPVASQRRAMLETVTVDGTEKQLAIIRIDDVSVAYGGDGKMSFKSWWLRPVTEPGSIRDDEGTVIQDSEMEQRLGMKTNADHSITITIDKDVHLYPRFESIKWLSFWSGPTGSGATYYPAQRCFNGIGPGSFNVPVWAGHTFKGWCVSQLEVNGTPTVPEIMITGSDAQLIEGHGAEGVYVRRDPADGELFLYLEHDATLYACWDGSDEVSYKIIIWKQKSTADASTPEKYKYDFVESVVKKVTPNSAATIDAEYKNYAATNPEFDGYTCRCDADVEQVNKDGYTVLNVYYDRTGVYTGTGVGHTLKFINTADDSQIKVVSDVAYNADLNEHVPDEPKRDNYSFSGWFADEICSTQVFFSKDALDAYTGYNKTVLYDKMPDNDLNIYAGWSADWYVVQIDPNYGAFNGTGATWMWKTIESDLIQEYTQVTRDYVESSSGNYYYYKKDRAYYGYSGGEWDNSEEDRDAGYTDDPGKATEYNTFEKAPGIYSYAGWYEVNEDGTETPFDFTQHITHHTYLKLKWKKAGTYYLRYDALEGMLDDGKGETEATDENGYADNSQVILTRGAKPRTTNTNVRFVGWRVRGDESGTVYSVGEVFTLKSEYAVPINGRDTLTLEAVYTKPGTASIVYDPNGGVIDFNDAPDFGSIITTTGETTIDTPVSATPKDGKAEVTGITNNSKFRLSNGAGFRYDGTGVVLAGWSNKAVYDPDDADAKFYAKDSNVGVDWDEPTTVYAVWQTTATYHLNVPANGNAEEYNWGVDTGWTGYDEIGGNKTQAVYLKGLVKEPAGIPQFTGSTGGYMFYFWTSEKDNDAARYDFTQPVTGALDLYAYWDGPVEVPIHAVDASAEMLISKDVDWIGSQGAAISVGTNPVSVSAAPTAITPANGYVLDFAVALDRTATLTRDSISEADAVASIYYNQAKKHLCVKYIDTKKADALLGEKEDIYFVYHQEKTLNIKYKSMQSSGALDDVAVNGALTATAALGECDLTYIADNSSTPETETPLVWVMNPSLTYYAFAIGSADAQNASHLSLITTAGDAASPSVLKLRNTWHGFEYSEDGTNWSECGYAPSLYVVYFTSKPTVIMFREKTVGSNAVMETEFTYDILVKDAEGNKLYGPESDGYAPYKLKNGEESSAILFYSSENAQSIAITQTDNEEYVVAITVGGQAYPTDENASKNVFNYTATSDGGTVDVTFTNTHKQAQVKINVARIDNGQVKKVDYNPASIDLPIQTSTAVKDAEPVAPSADDIFTDALGVYTCGTIVYGTEDADGNVTIEGLGVVKIAYGKIEGNHYEVLLKDGSGNTIEELGNRKLYFLYYPMPRVQYVKKVGENYELVKGTTNGVSIENLVTYNKDADFEMNGLKVGQDQRIPLSLDGLRISQATGVDTFKMPPTIDDGKNLRYLAYTAIGVGSPLAYTGTNTSGGALYVDNSDEPELRLQINNNKLEYYNGEAWTQMGEDQVIYAIYTERGYDLQVSEIVDTSLSGENTLFTGRIFTITVTSDAIIPGRFYKTTGTTQQTVKADDNEKKIELTMVNGMKVKIIGLGLGEYTITQSNNKYFTLEAKAGPIIGTSLTPIQPVSPSTYKLTLDTERQIVLTNKPSPICKIMTGNNQEKLFYTVQSAVEWVMNNVGNLTAEIGMLCDYEMPSQDTMSIPSSANITLTTAYGDEWGDEDYQYPANSGNNLAKISRKDELADVSLIVNSGSLTLKNIILDGNGVDGSAPLIRSTGSLTVSNNATLMNAVNSGNGGAIYATGTVTFNGEASVLKNNHANKGGLLYYAGMGLVTVANGSFTNNKAYTDGGAIYAESGTIRVSGGSMSKNEATENGGVIYAGSSLVNLTGKIGGNDSTTVNKAKNGGAIYIESGSFEISGSNAELRYNEATENGGAVYANSGTITVLGGSVIKNKAQENGGAFYVNTGTVNVNSGTIGGENNANTAKNGAAVFVSAGKGYFSGGEIKANTASEGGAVGVGVDVGVTVESEKKRESSAKLYFSGNINITGNTGKNDSVCNVYLNADSDGVINSNGLDGAAEIGIYVPDDTWTDSGNEVDLYTNRGDVGARFGSYTIEANKDCFKNDRQYEIGVNIDTNAMKLIWGSPVKLEIRLTTGAYTPTTFPPKQNTGSQKYNDNAYYPTKSNISLAMIGDSIRESKSLDLQSAAYAAAFVEGANQFSDYITRLVWEQKDPDNGETNYIWKYVTLNQEKVELGNKKISIYYSAPTFLSIENNTAYDLKIARDGLKVLDQSVIDYYGLVFALDDTIDTDLPPVAWQVEDDVLTIPSEGSINILVPGAFGKNFVFNYSLVKPEGVEDDLIVGLRYGDVDNLKSEDDPDDNIQVGPEQSLTNTLRPANGTYKIIFGKDKKICRIPEIDDDLNYPDGKQYATIKTAVNDAISRGLDTVTIEMMVDYLMPERDVLEITPDINGGEEPILQSLTLTTCEQYYNGGHGGRATISRATGNEKKPLVTIQGPNGVIDLALNVKNLDFDGKNLRGTCDGGAIKTINCKVLIEHSDYKNFLALNGGAVFVSFGKENPGKKDGMEYNFSAFPSGTQYPQVGGAADMMLAAYPYQEKALLTITDAKFSSCESRAVKPRCGGGAVWTNAMYMTLTDCDFTKCKAIFYKTGDGNTENQGGAVFHRIDGPNQTNYAYQPYYLNSHSFVTGCSFTGCEAQAGGGMECDSSDVQVRNCDFSGCLTKKKDGGGLNIYIYEKSYDSNDLETNVLLDGCNFTSCTAERSGGGVRSLAMHTTVTNCSFVNTSAKTTGGAIIATNKAAKDLNIAGTTIIGAQTKGGSGGAVHTITKELTVDALYDGDGKVVKQSVISSCTANGGDGGGIYHSNSNDRSYTKIKNSVIDNCIANNGGGYYTIKVKKLLVEDSIVEGCEAKTGNGGGICYGATKDNTTVNMYLINSKVTGNQASGSESQGGGVYVVKNLYLKDAEVTGNQLYLDNADVMNAAGIYILDASGTLSIGGIWDPVNWTMSRGTADTEADKTLVRDNLTKDARLSDMHLPEKDGGIENKKCVSVNAQAWKNENGQPNPIYVVNAKVAGTEFATYKPNDNNSSDHPMPDGYSDTDPAFKSDDGTLHGIIKRDDANKKTIVWAGPPVCKITDDQGRLLYFKNNGGDPAIFDVLDNGKDDRSSAFGVLRKIHDKVDNYKLYYRDEDGVFKQYTGSTHYVKMIVGEYALTNQITTRDKDNKTIIFTTAGKDDKDGYPLDPDWSKDYCTIRRGVNDGGSANVTESMLVAKTHMQIANLVLDGEEYDTGVDGAIIKVATDNGNVELQTDAILQRGKAANGGAVYVDKGSFTNDNGIIRHCVATGNGGAVYVNRAEETNKTRGFYMKRGTVQQCEAVNGGGVYVAEGVFTMTGGTISGCAASESGGGVFVCDGKTMDMSGGFIGYTVANTAAAHGGGVAVGGENATLNFSGQVNVSSNKLTDGTPCNVELNYDTNEVINAVTGEGLSPRAYIGVYVPGEENDDDGLYEKHGVEAKPFGYYVKGTVPDAQFYCFVNDRNGLKGGLIPTGTDNWIYWVRIFSLEVSKRVDYNENVVEDAQYSKLVEDQEFSFTVSLTEPPTNTSAVTVAQIAEDIRVNGANSKFGDIEFTKIDGTEKKIQGTVKLKDGEGHSAQNLPESFEYNVTETPTLHFAAMPTGMYAGSTGENKYVTSPGVDPYLSKVEIVNLLPVCKLVSGDGKLLYYEYRETVDSPTIYCPAVFKDLNQAIDYVNTKVLCTDKGDEIEHHYVMYGDPDVSIEMLVPEYIISETMEIEITTRKVTLTTANPEAQDNFPFRGKGTACIKRGTSFTNDSMLTLNTGTDVTLTKIILDGNKLTVDHKGGLAYVPKGGKLTIKDDAQLIKSHTTQEGAGVYLEDGSELHLSGNPKFSGKCTDAYSIFLEYDKLDANLVTTELTDKTNGGKSYKNAIQDIYLVEGDTEIDTEPSCIILDGNLTGVNGSIWIWAEKQPHYETLKPFAVIEESFYNILPDGKKLADATYKIFRDAQTDNLTLCGGDTYLTGTDGDNDHWVYWTGGFDVMFKKIDGSGNALAGATFTLYRDAACTDVYKQGGADLTATSADDSGSLKNSKGVTVSKGEVLFKQIPSGTYYMKETTAPAGNKVAGYQKDNDWVANVYLLLVGDAALKGATTYGLTTEDIAKQTAKYKTAYQLDNYAIFLCDVTDTTAPKAVTTPDIAGYGILDPSVPKRKVILRKVEDGSYDALQGAKFMLFRADLSQIKNPNTTDGSYTSESSGVYYIAMMEYGTYYVVETAAPEVTGKDFSGNKDKVFVLTINADGASITLLNQTDNSELHAAALAAAAAAAAATPSADPPEGTP